MTTIIAIAIGVFVLVFAGAIMAYAAPRFYIARTDRTFMTHDERGFKRALKGKGVLWDFEESIVKGPSAPKIEFVGLEVATGQRKMIPLIDAKTGSVNLRPQYCVPLPFAATTADDHRLTIEARIQFSLNRDLLKYVYQLEGFGLALETRIQSAFRAEIGMRNDEVLRASLDAVEAGAVERLRKAERDGDEAGEAGMALGVNFHSASFTYSVEDADAPVATPIIQAANAPGGSVAVLDAVRQTARAQGVLSLRPQHIDLLADVFKNRDPASTKAVLAILEMQTRQNIAEALASSGQLVVVTGQELGLTGATAQRDAIAARLAEPAPAQAPASNGAAVRA
ncbi:MAG TPA: hypothetical protein VG943_14815 [Caulobacterales bacterium]|nr:hypothetical protein [Caulobacterales bacterium]